jgi:hypothetical protein
VADASLAGTDRGQPTDPQVVSAYEYFGKQINPRDPSIGPEGVAFILAQQAQTNSGAGLHWGWRCRGVMPDGLRACAPS